jgi:hypothetical protein
VDEIAISPTVRGSGVGPNYDLARAFAPGNINVSHGKPGGPERTPVVNVLWWEWDTPDRIVRLQVQVYHTDKGTYGKAGELSDMRWSWKRR